MKPRVHAAQVSVGLFLPPLLLGAPFLGSIFIHLLSMHEISLSLNQGNCHRSGAQALIQDNLPLRDSITSPKTLVPSETADTDAGGSEEVWDIC